MAALTRRYKRGENQIYDDFYDRFLMESLLNAQARSKSFTHAGDWNDPNFLKSLILEWGGIVDKGRKEFGRYYYREAEEFRQAQIPILQDKLPEYKTMLLNYQQEQVNMGCFKPEKLPDRLEEEKLAVEAELDIRISELGDFQERLKKLPLKQPKPKLMPLFPYSVAHKQRQLLGAFKMSREPLMRDRRLVELTGQLVGSNKNGLRIIIDKRSPYVGMAAADFTALAKQWHLAGAKIGAAKFALEVKLEKQSRQDEFSDLWPKIKEKLFEQNPEWKDLFSLRFEDMQIFAWPPDVLNHSSVEAEKKVQMKRTT
ncbi:MAG: hypothetical protein KAX05_10180, partial [Bacteroidales bacterium]|nr:hypothetical protein [Bacteroidales bacterium]